MPRSYDLIMRPTSARYYGSKLLNNLQLSYLGGKTAGRQSLDHLQA